MDPLQELHLTIVREIQVASPNNKEINLEDIMQVI